MSIPSDVLRDLLSIDVFKLGSFQLKTGSTSPFYIDLRTVMSYPKIFNKMVDAIFCKSKGKSMRMDVVCGVPYTSLPISAAFCSRHELPLVMRRKEVKGYGTNKKIEGVFKEGDRCIIIEDTVVSGTSILETVMDLRKAGLVVKDCICILDRLQGGKENLQKHGIELHSLYDFNDIFSLYCSINTVEENTKKIVREYLEQNQCIIEIDHQQTNGQQPACHQAIQQPVAKRLRQVMLEKRTILCVAADVVQSAELLRIARELGPHICMLKTHVDILDDYNEDLPLKLKALAKEHNFLILEDRKFADIGETVRRQYHGGLFRISDWADIVTVHGIPGIGVVSGLKSGIKTNDRACVLIAGMSSEGSLADDSYRKKVIEMAEKEADFVMGFICQRKLVDSKNCIHMFPGVHISNTGDKLGQVYNTPEIAVENGADVIIVGRGICGSSDIVKTAIEYKTRAYDAYVKRCEEC